MLLIVLCTGAIELRAIRCAPAASAGSSIAPSARKHIARRISKVLRLLSERNCIAYLPVGLHKSVPYRRPLCPLGSISEQIFNLGGADTNGEGAKRGK